ncbi:MAG: hypothetical protein ACAH21_05535 [Ramlibacter sp.]|nr:hypothetical protein [Ramlibacter sp.]
MGQNNQSGKDKNASNEQSDRSGSSQQRDRGEAGQGSQSDRSKQNPQDDRQFSIDDDLDDDESAEQGRSDS